jgi:hypothetical protein
VSPKKYTKTGKFELTGKEINDEKSCAMLFLGSIDVNRRFDGQNAAYRRRVAEPVNVDILPANPTLTP